MTNPPDAGHAESPRPEVSPGWGPGAEGSRTQGSRTQGSRTQSHLARLPVSARCAVTALLFTLALGYLATAGSLYWSIKDVDGDPAWSMNDVIIHYRGTGMSRFEQMIRGPMKKEFSDGERGLQTVLDWVHTPGLPEREFKMKVWPILEMDCTTCHARQPADEDKSDAPLESYSDVMVFVNRVDTGISLRALSRMSHTHLFGIGLLIAALSGVLWSSGAPAGLKGWTSFAALAATVGDIASWWLIKLWAPFAYVSGLCAGVLGICMAIFVLVPLRDLWINESRVTSRESRV